MIKEKLRAESKTKLYLWAYDPVKQTNVNLGNGVMEVAQIINYGEDQKKKFRDKDTKKLISFNTRALNATLQMKSPDTSLHCSINLSVEVFLILRCGSRRIFHYLTCRMITPLELRSRLRLEGSSICSHQLGNSS